MFNDDAFSKIKKGARIVNVASSTMPRWRGRSTPAPSHRHAPGLVAGHKHW